MIALACDHTGIALKRDIMKLLDSMGLSWKDFGNNVEASGDDYPVYGYRAAKAVSDGECDRAILICGTGIGIGIAASKVRGTRVCTCSDVYSAELSKRHNNSNVLTLGARVVGTDLAKMIVEHWLTAVFEGGRHQRRIDMITAIENGTYVEDPALGGINP
ncbi:MAG: ribose 5-phosphate isomerase B [Clostridia bacterium]|nr:ribose 5-phosphate isomerase B [Clostridia bacterium]